MRKPQPHIHAMGGNATLQKYGKEHFSKLGKKTLRKYGKKHFAELSKKRWQNAKSATEKAK